jgi:hypothetical protein
MRETYSRKDQTDVLDADRTPADIVDTLRRLKFEDEFRLTGVDAAIRDYLFAAQAVGREASDSTVSPLGCACRTSASPTPISTTR